jgi:hypothetical protein
VRGFGGELLSHSIELDGTAMAQFADEYDCLVGYMYAQCRGLPSCGFARFLGFTTQE